jgi:hypothetical protein
MEAEPPRVPHLPDGFVSLLCAATTDCDDGDPCTIDRCEPSRQCSHTGRSCDSFADQCNAGECVSKDGSCRARPLNGKGCTTPGGRPGTCAQGLCAEPPECRLHGTLLGCSAKIAGTTATTSPVSVDDYACATGLTGPEYAYPLRFKTDRAVTASLSGAATDLDLIVLEGSSCANKPTCAAVSSTAGSGNETVTFDAKGNQDYLVVVDGRNGASGSYTLEVLCQGGACRPLGALACNQSIMGNTSSASATQFVSSTCALSTPGPEHTYTLTQTSNTQYKLRLTGLTQDLDLLVVLERQGECDPGQCIASSAQPTTADEEVLLNASGGVTYDVIVDSRAAGGPYLLEVACPVSCASLSSTLNCSSAADSRRNDDASKSKKVVDSWGSCAPNETGPEVVYRFQPDVTGSYTFELSGLGADLDLIVTSGGVTTCDPTSACVASSTSTGTADEAVTFTANAGQVYWIAVDGKNGAAGPYTLRLKSSVCAPFCASTNRLDCQSQYREYTGSSNDPARSLDLVDAWPCVPDTTGPEVVYWFQPSAPGQYSVSLDGLTANLELVVRKRAGYCTLEPGCVASSTNGGNTSESVTFAADTGATYWIAVDGKSGAAGNYHIKLSGPNQCM